MRGSHEKKNALSFIQPDANLTHIIQARHNFGIENRLIKCRSLSHSPIFLKLLFFIFAFMCSHCRKFEVQGREYISVVL